MTFNVKLSDVDRFLCVAECNLHSAIYIDQRTKFDLKFIHVLFLFGSASYASFTLRTICWSDDTDIIEDILI